MIGLLAWIATYLGIMFLLALLGVEPTVWEALGVVFAWGTANIVERAVND